VSIICICQRIICYTVESMCQYFVYVNISYVIQWNPCVSTLYMSTYHMLYSGIHESDTWVFRHHVTSDNNLWLKVFLLTKIKPEYSDILYNLTHFLCLLVCQIRQVLTSCTIWHISLVSRCVRLDRFWLSVQSDTFPLSLGVSD
jgi:hypothetical protein